MFIEKFYLKTVKYRLVNKFFYTNIKKLPAFKKISLDLYLKVIDVKKLFSSLLAFEIVANQKGLLTAAKTAVVSVKLRKGDPIGCKIVLKKCNLWKTFYNIFVSLLPQQSSVENKINTNKIIKKTSVYCKIVNPIKISELKKHYYFFNSLSTVNITMFITSKNAKETLFFFKSLRFL